METLERNLVCMHIEAWWGSHFLDRKMSFLWLYGTSVLRRRNQRSRPAPFLREPGVQRRSSEPKEGLVVVTPWFLIEFTTSHHFFLGAGGPSKAGIGKVGF